MARIGGMERFRRSGGVLPLFFMLQLSSLSFEMQCVSDCVRHGSFYLFDDYGLGQATVQTKIGTVDTRNSRCQGQYGERFGRVSQVPDLADKALCFRSRSSDSTTTCGSCNTALPMVFAVSAVVMLRSYCSSSAAVIFRPILFSSTTTSRTRKSLLPGTFYPRQSMIYTRILPT